MATEEVSFGDIIAKLEHNNDDNGLLQKLSHPADSTELKEGLDWLRQRFISGKSGARYSYVYANNLYHANVKDTAVFVFMAAKLMARVDAAYCEDHGNALSKISVWESGLADINTMLKNMDKLFRSELAAKAVAWEKKTRSRGKDEWLCSSGTSHYAAYHSKYGMDSSPHVKIVDYPLGRGKILELTEPDIKPGFVQESIWQQHSKQIVTDFWAEYAP